MEKTELIKGLLEDKNIEDIVIIDVREKTQEIDYIIVGTATSTRHARTVYDYLDEKLEDEGYTIKGREGKDDAHWILCDCGDILVNIFTKDEREKYRLEDLWTKEIK